MPLKDILVHLDATTQSAHRLEVALDLARRHEAHLSALFVLDITLPLMSVADVGAGAMMTRIMEEIRAQAREAAARTETDFRERLRRQGVCGEWRLAEGMVAETVALHARYADVAILGQEDPETTPPGGSGVIEDVLFAAGRPILAVPYVGRFPTIGRRVLIGWNASREAARAVNDALPLLTCAETVKVLVANPERGPDGHGDVPGADIALHLARHGIKVTVEQRIAPDLDAAELLLNEAADMGADLMVIGAYGHSRLREFILGGVTRTLLRSMTVPVLMSH